MMNTAKHPNILNQLNYKKLPTLSAGVLNLLTSLNDASIDIPQLTLTLERFPTIAARLIALANSVWSSPASEISSLEMACIRLGYNVVKSTSIALAVGMTFDPTRCPTFNGQRYWTRALGVAETAYQLAAYTPNTRPLTTRVAGLLHNLGLLWITDQLPDLTEQALQAHRHDKSLSLDLALTDLMGTGYRRAGAYLGKAWELPSPLTLTMRHHGEPEYRDEAWETVQLVSLAVLMVSSSEAELPCSAPLSLMKALQIDPDNADHVFSKLGSQLESTREIAVTLFAS